MGCLNEMELIAKSKLEKLKRKNRGNALLAKAIDSLVESIDLASIHHPMELKTIRPDADLVHSDGFYFFDLHLHRTMILIEFEMNGLATVVWCGSHDEYESIFKNNKNTIKQWLEKHGWV
jgi:mRNA-degrading endonuclease HigB of HigAB toxin-antitoxin module